MPLSLFLLALGLLLLEWCVLLLLALSLTHTQSINDRIILIYIRQHICLCVGGEYSPATLRVNLDIGRGVPCVSIRVSFCVRLCVGGACQFVYICVSNLGWYR